MTCRVMTHERYAKMLSEAGMLFKSDMPLSDKDSEPNMRRFSPSAFHGVMEKIWKRPDRRNGKMHKQVRTEYDSVEVEAPVTTFHHSSDR